MSAKVDPIEFREYLSEVFSDARLETHPINFGEIHLRFELGGNHPNGSGERIDQAVERSVILFSTINKLSDDIVLVVNDWDLNSNEFWTSEPSDYLFSLLQGYDAELACSELIYDDDSQPISRQTLYQTSIRKIAYSSILQGIANLEQGKSPAIGESIYFINRSRNIVFYMYDDRGCLIYADTPATLSELYTTRKSWLVQYYKTDFEEIFGNV